MRPIDADALIEKCGDWYVEEGTESGFIGTLKDLLATEPTIQPEKAQLSKEVTTKGTTSDMISRTETVERLRGVIDVTVPITDYDGGYVDGVEVGISMVSTMPTIQPERKKGEWIYNSPVTMKCDQCGLVIKDWDWHRFKICPNCGAKMKGERQK